VRQSTGNFGGVGKGLRLRAGIESRRYYEISEGIFGSSAVYRIGPNAPQKAVFTIWTPRGLRDSTSETAPGVPSRARGCKPL
jgi:hypothetical protein